MEPGCTAFLEYKSITDIKETLYKKCITHDISHNYLHSAEIIWLGRRNAEILNVFSKKMVKGIYGPF